MLRLSNEEISQHEGASSLKNWLGFLLRATVTIGICALLLAVVDVQAVADRLKRADLLVWTYGFLLTLLVLVFMARRWQLIMQQDGAEAPYGVLLFHYVESTFFALFLPSSIGGDVARGVRVQRQLGGARRTVVNIVTERLAGTWAICLLGAISLLSGGLPYSGVTRAILITYLTVIGATMLSFSRTVHRALNAALRGMKLLRLIELHDLVFEQFRSYLGNRNLLLQVILLSLIQQFCMIVSAYLVGQSAGVDLSLMFYLLAMPLVWLMGLLPALGGIGPREGTFVFLLTQAGIDADRAVAVAALFLATQVGRGVLGGFVFLYRAIRP